MTDIQDKDLDVRLEAYAAPPPSALLKARIIKAAQQAEVEPVIRPSFARRYMALAASLLVISAVGFTGLQMAAPTDTGISEIAALQQSAAEFGFEDIYEWVESEDVPS